MTRHYFLVFASLGLGSEPFARFYPVSFWRWDTGRKCFGENPFLFFISYIPIYLRILFWIVNHVLIDIRDGGMGSHPRGQTTGKDDDIQ
ncbi:hypothetical protein BJX62DRAFT_120780 [Aspergillus germanicus]